MQTFPCPICHSDIIVEDGFSRGDLIDCLNCNAELEIVSLQPLQIKPIDEIEEEE